jgi:3,4-dihydroxy 2-butanone 4-phosphate synthase / GTP cyclohydrolase II
MTPTWCDPQEAIAAIGGGGMVVVVDDEDREDEGDLVVAADAVGPADVAFIVRHTSGVVCVAVTEERAEALALPLMVARGEEAMGTAFTVTVDARHGTSTGISAADRAVTIRALADPTTVAADLVRPGHVFPLRARPGGVLRRAGHTEAAVDLARLAGREPAGVLCEIVAADGSMARRPDLARFAAEHGLPLLRIADLVRHRRRTERLVERVGTSRLPTRRGEFTAHGFRSVLDGVEHVALVLGDVAGGEPVLVRVHSECLTGDVLGSLRCDCGEQLDAAMAMIAAEGRGVVVYLRGHEGRGIGIAHKLRAYALQDVGHDTVDANVALGLPVDARDHGIGAHVLADLGVTAMRLMTNNPAKYRGLEGYGLEIVERVPLQVAATPTNRRYLETKRSRLDHVLDLPPRAEGA